MTKIDHNLGTIHSNYLNIPSVFYYVNIFKYRYMYMYYILVVYVEG